MRGALFSSKCRRPFLVVAFNTQTKTTKFTIIPTAPPPSNISSQILLLTPAEGASTTYPYKLRPPNFFLRPEGACARANASSNSKREEYAYCLYCS